MPFPIQSTIVLGGGSAGFLAALALKQTFPDKRVTLVRSPTIPIIGVGESTTPAVPHFLHGTLGFNYGDFMREVGAVWKLGNHFIWGDPRDAYFNYPFDFGVTRAAPGLRKTQGYYWLHDGADASLFSAMMNQRRAPLRITAAGAPELMSNHAWHLENQSFVAYLEKKARERGVELLEEDVIAVLRDERGDVTQLKLASGQPLSGDLFLDCSGFRSYLLSQTLGEKYVSYADSLFCDTAVVGSWRRDDDVQPYTTAETMNSGWCWRIEFDEHVTRGYVFSSQFCSVDEAIREVRAKNPKLPEDMRPVHFKSGRYENHWVGNVVAIGNAAGFVEPLEATALQMIVEQLRFLCKALLDSDAAPTARMIAHENRRVRILWDDIRDFLALHYRFNRRLETPFWQHCRAATALGGAADLVAYYEELGPSILAEPLVPRESIFGLEGYLTILLGQRAPTRSPVVLHDKDLRDWQAFQASLRQEAGRMLSVREALRLVQGK